MKKVFSLSLGLLLALAVNGCATAGGKESSGPAPTVSGSISTGVTTHF